MKRLRESELIFGRLLRIDEPHLIARYNKALKALTGRQTALGEFRIDMAGFSPEIAEELGDEQYLDPNGVNRRFIVLTPDQENLPVVNTQFSNTAGLMHEFYRGNRRAILAITIKDALYGEIDDPVTEVGDVEDLLTINEVTFRVMSADGLLAKAAELRTLIDQLTTTDTAWRDDALLNRMVDLAQETGDIRQNALVPDKLIFPHHSYWASHFGGVFLFHDERAITVICDSKAPGFRRSRPWEVSYIDIDDHARIFDYLAKTRRLQMPQASWVEASGLYTHRAEMAMFDLVRRTEPDTDFSRIDRNWMRSWMKANARLVEGDGIYPFFHECLLQIRRSGRINMRDVARDRRILLVRGDPEHEEVRLVNRLLAKLMPFDFVSRFIFGKNGFYDSYRKYPDNYRRHVVDVLANTYLADKAALRVRLYGIDGARNHA